LEISKEITHRISQRFKIQVSSDEMVNIAMRMLSIRSRQTLSSEDFSMDETLSSDVIEKIVLQMIQEASKILHPILSIDQKLKRGLLVHMKPAINRLIFNLPIRNLLLPEIKAKYPYIFMVSEESAKILEENIGCSIPEEEIGFIAMHFAAAMERLRTVSDTRIKTLVVCGGGCATAWMLVSRIQAEFPELEVLRVCSVLELSERSLKGFGIDLIISTIPLENLEIPTVVVSPLLSDKERDDIKSEIDEIGDKNSENYNFLASDSGFSITTLLNQNTIQTDVAAVDWRDAIVKSCQPLIAQGDIDEKYVGGIEDLLVKHGPYMVLAKEVVLLHAMIGYGVNKVCMSLSTYSPPVYFGHPSNDPVSVGIVFGTIDGRSHLKALSQLSRLLGDQEFIFRLKKSQNAQEIIDLLAQTVNKN
jgi:mannitol/fructose-specific phosphotransferase system IIA component (Ntr-type)/galactitol-specific phosphotransferase system IIB component